MRLTSSFREHDSLVIASETIDAALVCIHYNPNFWPAFWRLFFANEMEDLLRSTLLRKALSV